MSENRDDRDVACPPWCDGPPMHWEHLGVRHAKLIFEMPMPAIDDYRSSGERPMAVEVQRYIDWDGAVNRPGICLATPGTGAFHHGEEHLTPGEARKLAAALVQAADLADQVP